MEACPHTPGRIVWDPSEKKAKKCDLCADTPYWEKEGGAEGKQVCVEVCPYGAIMLSHEVPVQEGTRGYEVDIKVEEAK